MNIMWYSYLFLYSFNPNKQNNLLRSSGRRRRWRLECTCAGVFSLWSLWSKEAASASTAWRLSWRQFWRALWHSTHLVSRPPQPSKGKKCLFVFFYITPAVSLLPFSSPETGLEQRHMAFCSLFSDALALLNGVGVSTGEALAAHVITWLDRKGRGFPILPLLTACSRCLASVRHMTRIMEACITAHFNHGNSLEFFWKPIYLTKDFFLLWSVVGL